ncbi:MAG TPA: DUF3179 domain-containing (seleno)protein [Saprospiraceae bacterium]|nr:DUF3179 domain-containing (seleno)protein [Saprospiraceae bacterium]
MKYLLVIGISGLWLFEFFNIYFIMPMPGSQQLDSLDFAYFLYTWRWVFRVFFTLLTFLGLYSIFKSNKNPVRALLLLLLTGCFIYFLNFKMSADYMFLQPEELIFQGKDSNSIPDDRLLIGIEINGEAKAYPIQLISYHHQVIDTVGGKPVMVTYCNVCRTGRVYEPKVLDQEESFRLVGMDHYNAMFEDQTTKSWWRQVTGEAVSGKLKGAQLPEIESMQMTVEKWFDIYPNGKVMQPDHHFESKYEPLARFEKGKSTGRLTRTDTIAWQEKSWVIGISAEQNTKAYSWQDIKTNRIIHDSIEGNYLLLALSKDGQSFVVFERAHDQIFLINNQDELISGESIYDFSGYPKNTYGKPLKRIQAYQEFWHSWYTFQPETITY